MGLDAKSYMRKSFLIYEEMHKYFRHISGGRQSYMTLQPIPLNFPLYEENVILFFISVQYPTRHSRMYGVNACSPIILCGAADESPEPEFLNFSGPQASIRRNRSLITCRLSLQSWSKVPNLISVLKLSNHSMTKAERDFFHGNKIGLTMKMNRS